MEMGNEFIDLFFRMSERKNRVLDTCLELLIRQWPPCHTDDRELIDFLFLFPGFNPIFAVRFQPELTIIV